MTPPVVDAYREYRLTFTDTTFMNKVLLLIGIIVACVLLTRFKRRRRSSSEPEAPWS